MVGLPHDTRTRAESVDLSCNDGAGFAWQKHVTSAAASQLLCLLVEGLVIVDLDKNDIHPFILPIPALPPKIFSGILNDLMQVPSKNAANGRCRVLCLDCDGMCR